MSDRSTRPKADILNISQSQINPATAENQNLLLASQSPFVDIETLGSFTAISQTIVVALNNGYQSIVFQASGTWVGQIEIEISVDGTNYVAHDFLNSGTDAIVNAIAGNGIFFAGVSGFKNFRLRTSAWTSGTATITIRQSIGNQSVHIESPLPAGTNVLGAMKFVDNLGVAFGNKQFDNRLATISMPYGHAISHGLVPNHTPVRQLGYNPDVDNVREDLWELGGTYVFPPAGGIQMAFVSDNVNDTAAGTGARTADIHYLNASFVEMSENIILNGTTAVNTIATDILRINDIHVMTVGTNETSVGNLSLRNLAGTITYGYIAATGNASRQCIYTVPAGFNLFITGFNVGVGHNAGGRLGEFSVRATTSHDDELTPGVFHFKNSVIVQDGSIYIPFPIPLKCVSMSDVKISVKSDLATASAICAGSWCGWLDPV